MGFEHVPGIPQAVVDTEGFLHEKAYLAMDPVDGTTNFACGGPDWGGSATPKVAEFGSIGMGNWEAQKLQVALFLPWVEHVWTVLTCRER